MSTESWTAPRIEDIRERLDLRPGAPVRVLSQIRLLVVHYNAVRRPERYNEIEMILSDHRYHRNIRNWGRPGGPIVRGHGLMYHLVIGGSGQIYQTRDYRHITWQANDANRWALGVMLHCGAGQEPSGEQVRSLYEVLMLWCYHSPEFPAGRSDVYGHCELTTAKLRALGFGVQVGNVTPCPDRILPYAQRFRRGEW